MLGKLCSNLLCAVTFSSLFSIVLCSNGDQTTFFKSCRENCERQNCSADGIDFQEQTIVYYQQTVFDQLLQWSCVDECQYGCMWRTVDAFQDRYWPIPQFYGKWPFKRFMGLQEPASVVFSLLNFFSHFRNIRRFKREVRSDSPCYLIWQIFSLVCLNGWIWSTVFHSRDFPLTELLDYAFAYSMTLVMFYCMLMRMLHKNSVFLRGLLSAAFVSYFINYFAYLSIGKFSYSLNILTNIITGALGALGWIIWSIKTYKTHPHYRKIISFYFLLALCTSLELVDFPPILWAIDAHALWHLSTSFITPIFYSFIIDDCKVLRKEVRETKLNYD